MKKCTVVLGLLVLAASARANDSAIEGVGGTPTVIGSLKKVAPMQGEHPSIRMVRETIAITVGATNYDVVANFEFHNDGAARKVLMGFPEGAGGDTDFAPLVKKSSFQKFRTSVDGKTLKARRIPVPEEGPDVGPDFEFDSYWVKSVPFARHQTRRVRVSYRAPLGDTTDSNYLSYDFTGGNWKGRVAQSVLSVHFTSPGHYLIWPIARELKAQQWHKGDTLYFRWKNWQAENGFNLRFRSNLQGALHLASNPAELKEEWSYDAGQTSLIVSSADKNYDAWRAPVTKRTDYLLRDGHAFASISALAEEIKDEYQRRTVSTTPKQKYGSLKWDKRAQTATLRLGSGKTIAFWAGSKVWKVDGKNFSAPVKSFIGGSGDSATLYVPLAAAVRLIGGKVLVNTETNRVWLDLSKIE